MGLDIAFNRKAALNAGLVVFLLRCGREYIQVPNAHYSVENNGVDIDIVVRANKWGSTYAPLTEWLKANNITWSEF